jgi:hypothetical protein
MAAGCLDCTTWKAFESENEFRQVRLSMINSYLRTVARERQVYAQHDG